jgi:hypothetical protein
VLVPLAELRAEVAVCPPLTLGADVIFAATTIVSLAAMAAAVLIVTGTVTVSPTRAVGTVPIAIDEIVLPVPAAAVAGTADNPPNPSATTATSATRLKVVFVDILFLSVSRSREFPSFGLNQISLIRFDESHVLIHQIPHRVSGRGEETYLVIHLHCLR